MATQTVNILVTSQGTVTVQRNIDAIGDSAKKSGEGLSAFQGLLTTLVSTYAIKQLADYADSYTNIQNRLKLVTSGTQDLSNVSSALLGIANGTYQAFDSVATIYARTRTATQQLGYTTQQTLDFTKQLAQATALSGVSAETANLALVQLAQGLAAGTLHGQDLNSVLEGLPYLSKAIATGLNTNVGNLKQLAEQGKITSQQIVEALSKVAPNIAADFAKLTPTIGQSLVVLSNQFTALVGYVSSTTGVFNTAALAILYFSDHLAQIAIAISPVVAAFVILGVQIAVNFAVNAVGAALTAIAQLVIGFATLAASMVSSVIEVGIMAAAFLAANATMIIFTTIILGVAAAVAYVADYLLNGGKAAKSFSDYLSSSVDTALTALGSLKDVVGDALKGGNINFNADKATQGLNDASKDIKGGITSGADALTAAGKSAGDSITKAAQSLAQYTATALSGFPTAEALQNSDYNSNPGLYPTDATTGKPVYKPGQTKAGQIQAYGYALDGSSSGSVSSGGSSGSSGGVDSSYSSKPTGNSYYQSYYSTFTTPQQSNTNGQSYSSIADAAAAWNASVVNSMSSQVITKPGAIIAYDDNRPGSGTAGRSGAVQNFAKGGSFRVGGSGGTDSQLVQFRASPDEHVTIETPEQRNGGSGTTGDINVAAPNVNVVLDAASLAQVLSTKAGKEAMMTHIKFDQSGFRKALGIS